MQTGLELPQFQLVDHKEGGCKGEYITGTFESECKGEYTTVTFEHE
jgi:hypothetical protein